MKQKTRIYIMIGMGVAFAAGLLVSQITTLEVARAVDLPGTISNYIWNSSAVPPGGTTPQTATINLAGSIQGTIGSYSSLAIGSNVMVANLPGYANTVGIGTATPNALYKLDVAGKTNATEVCINGICKTSWDCD
jgi:hypothetical protein